MNDHRRIELPEEALAPHEHRAEERPVADAADRPWELWLVIILLAAAWVSGGATFMDMLT